MVWLVLRALVGTAIVSVGALVAYLFLTDTTDPGSWWPFPSEHVYQPAWCDDYEADDKDYSGPANQRAKPKTTPRATGAPASTAGTTPADAVSAGFPGTGPQSDRIDPKRVDRAATLDTLEADGSDAAAGVRRGLAMSPEENIAAGFRFVFLSEHSGVLGLYRLGIAFLGDDAFEIAKSVRPPRNRKVALYVPYCRDARFLPVPDTRLAHRYFSYAKRCGQLVAASPDAQAWLDAIKDEYPNNDYATWEREAQSGFVSLMELHGYNVEDPEAEANFCLALPSFGPTGGTSCTEAATSRQALKLGESKYAEGKTDAARACWRRAIQIVKTDDDADAAVAAQRRLQTMTTTCTWSPESLAAINRDYEARSADLITVSTIQNALKALGHYEGPIDGQLSLATRIAIRKYQRERSEDETDILSPLQITNLVCNAAETTRSPMAANTLGLMYTVGLGVKQNIDKAQQWLTEAANRNHAEAKYNLALLYGTGIILKSYRLCDVPRAPEQADKYLQEAAGQGLPKALDLLKECRKFSSLAAPERWMLIERQLIDRIRSGPFANNFRSIGKNCAYEGIQHEPTGAQE